MRIDVLCVLPELLESPLSHSIVGRARARGVLTVNAISLRDFTHDTRRTVDDYAYGPDSGMVLRPEPIFEAYDWLTRDEGYDEVLFPSPDGELVTQPMVNGLSLLDRVLIICGHYKGVDQRVRDTLVTREVSLGDYVLSGGELAAAVLVDAMARVLPGAIGDETSALTDSFQDGLLAPPVYTRPAEYRGLEVPAVLRSGNFAEIAQWQHREALSRTQRLRPALYAAYVGADESNS